MRHDDLPDDVNEVTREVVDAAIMVHRELGPGLLERAYRVCLAQELAARGLRAAAEVEVPLVYRGVVVEAAFRMDLLVEDSVVVEVKAVELLHRVHFAQLLTYLRLTGHDVGLLLNFHSSPLKDGIHRLIRHDRS